MVENSSNRKIAIAEFGTTGSLEQRLMYTHDAAGNRKTVQDSMGNLTSHTYDATYRLVGSESTGNLNYNYSCTYDPSGNRLTSNDTESRLCATALSGRDSNLAKAERSLKKAGWKEQSLQPRIAQVLGKRPTEVSRFGPVTVL